MVSNVDTKEVIGGHDGKAGNDDSNPFDITFGIGGGAPATSAIPHSAIALAMTTFIAQGALALNLAPLL